MLKILEDKKINLWTTDQSWGGRSNATIFTTLLLQ